MEYSFRPRGICPSKMKIIIEDGIITDVKIRGGCDGNLKAIINLIKGNKPEEVIPLLEGIECGHKKTSCPDQLSIALKEAIKEG